MTMFIMVTENRMINPEGIFSVRETLGTHDSKEVTVLTTEGTELVFVDMNLRDFRTALQEGERVKIA